MDANLKTRVGGVITLKGREGIAFGNFLISMSLFGMLSAVAIPGISHLTTPLRNVQPPLLHREYAVVNPSRQHEVQSEVFDEYALDSMLGVFSSDQDSVTAKMFASKKALSPREMDELISQLDPTRPFQKTIDSFLFNPAQGDTQVAWNANTTVTSTLESTYNGSSLTLTSMNASPSGNNSGSSMPSSSAGPPARSSD